MVDLITLVRFLRHILTRVMLVQKVFTVTIVISYVLQTIDGMKPLVSVCVPSDTTLVTTTIASNTVTLHRLELDAPANATVM
jgi:hypothetical protein